MYQSTSNATTIIAASCTYYASISVVVPGPGTVVVTASVRWIIDHTAGTADSPRVFLDETQADCTNDQYRVFGVIALDEGTGTTFMTMVVLEPFAVAAAGGYQYYLNADLGSGNDSIYGAGFVAVFYPD